MKELNDLLKHTHGCSAAVADHLADPGLVEPFLEPDDEQHEPDEDQLPEPEPEPEPPPVDWAAVRQQLEEMEL